MIDDIDDLLWVILPDPTKADDFLKIREVLTRIGTPVKGKSLKQICYLYHRDGRYAICHYKELRGIFEESNEELTDYDIDFRDVVAKRLEDWGMLKVLDQDYISEAANIKIPVKIIKYAEKDDWHLISTFNFRKYRNRPLTRQHKSHI